MCLPVASACVCVAHGREREGAEGKGRHYSPPFSPPPPPGDTLVLLQYDDDTVEKCFRNAYSTIPMRWLTACCFFSLSLVLAFYGTQVMPCASTGARGPFNLTRFVSQMAQLDQSQCKRFLIDYPRTLGVLNCVLFLDFLSKGIYEVLTIYGLW